MIPANDYLAFLGREYLEDFVRRGGATVKFAVPVDGADLRSFTDGLGDVAVGAGYTFASVDAAVTKAHMVDQLFFAVSRQVDWDAMARTFLRRTLATIAFPVPDELDRFTLEALARHHEYDVGELNKELNKALQQSLFHDYAMAQEFRIAMLRLCQAQLFDDDLSRADHQSVIDWLTGELRHITRLRSAQIFRRIARNNARHMLYSLAHWCTRTGTTGLAVHVDITRCQVARRPVVEERVGVYYSKPAVMDTYEVLRQLVDSTDELSSCCVVVTTAPEFLTDDVRGLGAYTALQMRIWDEVRDRRRDNPYAAMVRLGTAS